MAGDEWEFIGGARWVKHYGNERVEVYVGDGSIVRACAWPGGVVQTWDPHKPRTWRWPEVPGEFVCMAGLPVPVAMVGRFTREATSRS